MALIVTPSQLARRGEFYDQVGSLLHAGVGVIQALEMVRDNPPSRAYRQVITQGLAQIQQGRTLVESLASNGGWLPELDRALLEAGEQSGRLPEAFRLLAQNYRQRAQLARQVIGELLYPLVLGHFAVLIFPPAHLTRIMQGSLTPGQFLGAKLALLIPVYAAVLLLVLACQARHGEFWQSVMETLLGRIPGLGRARRSLALARLSAALEALIRAGVSIIEGWQLAAAASGSPALRRVVRGWSSALAAGETPGELIGRSSVFPDLFRSLYLTGEQSGQLDESLQRLHRLYQEEGSRRLQLFAQWLPRLIYFLIVLAIGYFIVSFWAGYFSGVTDVLDF